MNEHMHIGLVYDLRSDYLAEGFTEEQVAEFDSRDTIDALESALLELGYRPERIGHGRTLAARLVAGDRWDMVLSIAEGLAGRSREAQVPCLLEMYGVPYVFSDPLVCAVTLDKAITKRLLHGRDVATAPFVLVERAEDVSLVALSYPVFAKPVAEGTGKGVTEESRCDTPEQLHALCSQLLAHFDQPLLVEEYLPGREFTTALLGTGAAARVLGTMEVCIREDAPTRDYSYEVKEKCELFVEYRRLEKGALQQQIETLALAAYRVLECRDTGRVDVRLDREGRPVFIEINPLPGLHPHHSDLPMIATQEGLPYVELIRAIMDSARERLPRNGTA